VREHLETFLARRAEAGEPMPAFVVDELRDYLLVSSRASARRYVVLPDCRGAWITKYAPPSTSPGASGTRGSGGTM
jgi:hypothetical protein